MVRTFAPVDCTEKRSTLIFDLDGTLIDSAGSILAGFDFALSHLGMESAVPLSQSLIGAPLHETLSVISGCKDEVVLATLANAFKEHYDTEGCKATTVFPGVQAMLTRLSAAGTSLHLATNKRCRPTVSILSHLGWDGLFKSVYSSDMRKEPITSKGKMLRLQWEEQAIDVCTAAYIGDRVEDGRAADENGFAFYMAMWGYSGAAEESWPRHWMLARSPDDLP